MSELDKFEAAQEIFDDGVFIPSHLTKGMVGAGVAIAAGGLTLLASGYAVNEFRKVSLDEITAFITGGGGSS